MASQRQVVSTGVELENVIFTDGTRISLSFADARPHGGVEKGVDADVRGID